MENSILRKRLKPILRPYTLPWLKGQSHQNETSRRLLTLTCLLTSCRYWHQPSGVYSNFGAQRPANFVSTPSPFRNPNLSFSNGVFFFSYYLYIPDHTHSSKGSTQWLPPWLLTSPWYWQPSSFALLSLTHRPLELNTCLVFFKFRIEREPRRLYKFLLLERCLIASFLPIHLVSTFRSSLR